MRRPRSLTLPLPAYFSSAPLSRPSRYPFHTLKSRGAACHPSFRPILGAIRSSSFHSPLASPFSQSGGTSSPSVHPEHPLRHFSRSRIVAMDVEKFKAVDDIGFARRHRFFHAPDDNAYSVAKDTLQIAEWRGVPALTASVTAHDRTALKLAIIPTVDNVFRVVLDDLNEPTHQRHVVEEGVVVYEGKPSLDDTELIRENSRVVFKVDDWAVRLEIQYDPFRIDLVSIEGDNVLMTINEDCSLMVEAFEKKPSQGISDIDGRWAETFRGFTDPKPRGPESVGVDVTFPFAEHMSGIPERTTAYNLADTLGVNDETLSQPYRLYTLDVSYFELDNPLGLYGAVPLLIGRKGKDAAAVFWLNTSETFVDLRSEGSGAGRKSHWYSETGLVDMFVLPGPTTAEVFQQYLQLTGAPALPPRFSLGYHQCRYSYMSQEDALAVNAGFEKEDIPYDVLWLDIDHTDEKRYFTWDERHFPNPTDLQNEIASHGRKIVTIIDPHIKVDPRFSLHKLATKQNLYVTNPDGTPYYGKCWAGVSGYFDYTSERARAAWASRFNVKDYPHFTPHLFVWNDMNEPSVFDGPEGSMPKHMTHADGVEHRHVHNTYGHNMLRATYDGLLSARDGKQRPFVLTRSFFAGSQRYGFVWTGDNSARWDHLASSVPMLLSLQTSGIVASGADVGGFFYDPQPDLVVRWYQAGAFQPFFRGHSFTETKRREPWLFGEPYTSLIRAAIKVRYTLLPYWYTLFAGIARGVGAGFPHAAVAPPMRPLSWEFPDENDDDSRWLVGDKLMVAPVVEERCEEYTIRLPQGAVWYDLFNHSCPGKKLPETDRVTLASPLGRMFVFQRGGTIVPRLDTPRRSSAGMAKDPYTLAIALDKAGTASGELYVDDGESYEYEKGAFVLRRFTFGDGVLSASTVAGSGGFKYCEAKVQKVYVLGFGGDAPKGVEIKGRSVNFSHDAESQVLTIDGVDEEALLGEWRLNIQYSE